MGVTLPERVRDDDNQEQETRRVSESGPHAPRVLFLASSTGNGGIERHAAGLAVRLRNEGVPLACLCRPGAFFEAVCAAQGVPTHPVQVRNSGDLPAVHQIARQVRRHRADILHVHSRRDFVPAALAVILLGFRGSAPRLVLHAHLDKPLGMPPRLSGLLFRRSAQGIVAVSEAVRQTLLAAHSLPASLVRVIPNSLETSRFAVPGDPRAGVWRRQQRRCWNIPPGALVVGMVGRLPDKGQAALLTLAPRLLEKCPRLWLVFVGPNSSEADRLGLETTAASFGLTGRVVFAGPSEDVPAAMAALDILAHFPQSEAFGLALLEAMASGLPVVACRVGGCAEVVQDGVTSLLVPPGDAESRLAALSFLLDAKMGAARRAMLGTAGRVRAVACFAPEAETAAVRRFYERLLHENRTPW